MGFFRRGASGTGEDTQKRIALDDRLGRIEADLARLQADLVSTQRRLPPLGSQSTSVRQPVVEIRSKGNLANRMIQFMTAASIADKAKGCRISGADLPEWNIKNAVPLNDGDQVTVVDSHRVPVERLAGLLRDRLMDRVVLEGYCQHVDNFMAPERYRDLFALDPDLGRTTDADSLLISIRGGEILHAPHDDYVLLPVQFYAEVVAASGLKPVFMGQLTPSPYMDALRRQFPDAVYMESMGAMADFATITRAKNIVISISTFSWLAAWLSDADQIFLPLSGFTNPLQCPDVDLVPKNDPRYRLFLFPINYAVEVSQYEPAHNALAGRWRPVTVPEVTQLRKQFPSEPRVLEDYLRVFDETYYTGFWGDVGNSVATGWIATGRDHFAGPGFTENRRAFPLDRKFYSVTYPESAQAIAEGRYLDLWHYHAHLGHLAGNRLHAGDRPHGDGPNGATDQQ